MSMETYSDPLLCPELSPVPRHASLLSEAEWSRERAIHERILHQYAGRHAPRLWAVPMFLTLLWLAHARLHTLDWLRGSMGSILSATHAVQPAVRDDDGHRCRVTAGEVVFR